MADKMHSARRLILIELNEINFDVVRRYVASRHNLPGFTRLLAGSQIATRAEPKYESIEPWIQWPSAHLGLSADEHRIFRLGDIVSSKEPQFFEQLERHGLRVGAVSPMNAENRLADPAYFIPDPWTSTPPDRSWWSRALAGAVSQAVNDNSKGTITARSVLHLALAMLRFAQPKHYSTYLRLALRSRGAPWRKALLLDLLLHDVHVSLFSAGRADFSTLFLNAGAHIQHHYFFNSRMLSEQVTIRNPDWYVAPELDPISEMLDVYDLVVRDYLAMTGVDVIVATGLSQTPYDRVKFYWRLRDHADLLRTVGIRFKQVLPRMTRDFLIEFETPEDACVAEGQLVSLNVDGVPLFGDIDNRGDSLFVTLTYPSEVSASTQLQVDGRSIPLSPHVVFVAIKNGMHQDKGFAFFTPNVVPFAPRDGDHVKELHSTITGFFGLAKAPRPA